MRSPPSRAGAPGNLRQAPHRPVRKHVGNPRRNHHHVRTRSESLDVLPADQRPEIRAFVPPVAHHLEPFADAARRRQDKGDFWWELRACDYYDVLDGAKIVYPDIAKGPRFFLDEGRTYIANTAYCLGSADPYLLGILNSKLFWFVIGKLSIPFGTRAGEFRYRLIYQYMANVPIRPISPDNSDDRRLHDLLVVLVRRMLALNQQLEGAISPPAKTPIERQIQATDAEIDRLVCELYGLTEEETQIVNGETGRWARYEAE
jgi:hypothetical protein